MDDTVFVCSPLIPEFVFSDQVLCVIFPPTENGALCPNKEKMFAASYLAVCDPPHDRSSFSGRGSTHQAHDNFQIDYSKMELHAALTVHPLSL